MPHGVVTGLNALRARSGVANALRARSGVANALRAKCIEAWSGLMSLFWSNDGLEAVSTRVLSNDGLEAASTRVLARQASVGPDRPL